MIKEVKINKCLGKISGKVCDFEYMSYDENSKCPKCGAKESDKKNIILLDLNETIGSIEEKRLATSCVNSMSDTIYSFNTEVVMNSPEFRMEIQDWIKDNKITAALVCYAYSRGNYNVMENSDYDGFNILLNLPDEPLTIPNTNMCIDVFEEMDKLEEEGEDYTLIVQDDVYIHSNYMNDDLLLLKRSSSSDYNGDNFRETLSLTNYTLVKIIYEEIKKMYFKDNKIEN